MKMTSKIKNEVNLKNEEWRQPKKRDPQKQSLINSSNVYELDSGHICRFILFLLKSLLNSENLKFWKHYIKSRTEIAAVSLYCSCPLIWLYRYLNRQTRLRYKLAGAQISPYWPLLMYITLVYLDKPRAYLAITWQIWTWIGYVWSWLGVSWNNFTISDHNLAYQSQYLINKLSKPQLNNNST